MPRRQAPKHYRSLEEFNREEIRSGTKYGWSLDDLYQDATYRPGEDPSLDQGGDPKELDFDF
ncbi:MAG TPA: hypothetical protein RMF84_06695 [Polyangiaceae bacterium LLY-WYZ-14_1]|jgi:hypothetical protein|nr:hypothetical protein [Polyangiaceae bacterium LLY-WYZ-14_1]